MLSCIKYPFAALLFSLAEHSNTPTCPRTCAEADACKRYVPVSRMVLLLHIWQTQLQTWCRGERLWQPVQHIWGGFRRQHHCLLNVTFFLGSTKCFGALFKWCPSSPHLGRHCVDSSRWWRNICQSQVGFLFVSAGPYFYTLVYFEQYRLDIDHTITTSSPPKVWYGACWNTFFPRDRRNKKLDKRLWEEFL